MRETPGGESRAIAGRARLTLMGTTVLAAGVCLAASAVGPAPVGQDLSAARAAAAALPQLHSLLVSHRGALVLEHSGRTCYRTSTDLSASGRRAPSRTWPRRAP